MSVEGADLSREFHHAPKPWFGWNEFLREYIIVVVGVLTAAALGLILNWLHDRQEVREARAALHAELVRNATLLRDTMLENQCLLAGADRLMKLGNDLAPPAQAPTRANGFYGRPSTAVWDTVRSGAVTRMPLEEKVGYANFYDEADFVLYLSNQKLNLMEELAAYWANFPPTLAEVHDARRSAVKAQVVLSALIPNEQRLLDEAKALGAQPTTFTRWKRAALEEECRAVGVSLNADGEPLGSGRAGS